MDERVTPSPTWHPLEALPVALLVFLGTMLLATAFGLVLGPHTGFVLSQLSFEVLIGVTTVVWIRLRHAGVHQLGLGRAGAARDVGFGLGSGVLLYLVAAIGVGQLLFWLYALIAGHQVTPPVQEVLPPSPTDWQLALVGLAVMVAAPIGEELFFRGLLFGSLRVRMGFWWSAIISSAVFAVVHILPLLMPLFFVVGMGLAYIYERRRSLWATIGAHMAFNIIGFSLIMATR